MKIAATIARYLLGVIFLFFGLNGFLHFIPMESPGGVAGQYFGALYASHYLVVIFLLELIPAVLLLANRFVPLALTVLAPLIVNIFFFHALMAPSGLGLAVVVVVLWLLTYASVHTAFKGLFQAKVEQ